MLPKSPNRGYKHRKLAERFTNEFKNEEEFTSSRLSNWPMDKEYRRQMGEDKTEHARYLIGCLRMAGDHPRLKEKAFRIISLGRQHWKKQLITPDTLGVIQAETTKKLGGAVNNGQRRNSNACDVLDIFDLKPNERAMLKVAKAAYPVVDRVIKKISNDALDKLRQLQEDINNGTLREEKSRDFLNEGKKKK